MLESQNVFNKYSSQRFRDRRYVKNKSILNISKNTYKCSNPRFHQSRIKDTYKGLLIIKCINQVSNNPRYQSNHNTIHKHVKNKESKILVNMCL